MSSELAKLSIKIQEQDTEVLELIPNIINHLSHDEKNLAIAKEIESSLNNFDFNAASQQFEKLTIT